MTLESFHHLSKPVSDDRPAATGELSAGAFGELAAFRHMYADMRRCGRPRPYPNAATDNARVNVLATITRAPLIDHRGQARWYSIRMATGSAATTLIEKILIIIIRASSE